MNEKLQISLDKLPLKRVEAIEENGAERFPSYASLLPLIFSFLGFTTLFGFRENCIQIVSFTVLKFSYLHVTNWIKL